MRKLSIVVASVFLMTAVFVVPAMARSVLELNIVKCGDAGAADGCGSNPSATDPLDHGKVEVDDDGEVDVELEGAAPNTTYTVFVGNWVTSNGFQAQFVGTGIDCGGGNVSVGTVTTDAAGDFDGPITTSSAAEFFFPFGTKIGQINFAFNNPPCPQTQFTTGIAIP